MEQIVCFRGLRKLHIKYDTVDFIGWINGSVRSFLSFVIYGCSSPVQSGRRVCTRRQWTCSPSLSWTSCVRRPCAGWWVCLASWRARCRWAPCPTALWCTASSYYAGDAQSHCGSLWRKRGTTRPSLACSESCTAVDHHINHIKSSQFCLVQIDIIK